MSDKQYSYSNLPDLPRGLTYQPIMDDDGTPCHMCQAIVGSPGVLIGISRKALQTYQGYFPADGTGFCLECFQEQFGKFMYEMSERAQHGIEAQDELQNLLDGIEDTPENKAQRDTYKERIQMENDIVEGIQLFIDLHAEIMEAASQLEVEYLTERIVDDEMRADFEGK